MGVYVSVPFCSQKCTFCNFASGVGGAGLVQEYVAALEAEIARQEWEEIPDTLYLGGGTPGSLEQPQLRGILGRLPVIEWKEATIEAAPGNITSERADGWRRLGLDRVSLGVQSFVDGEIRAVGRKHSAQQVESEVKRLREAGIHKMNIDLIAGLPYQTRESWRESLDWVERLDPPHASVYMLETDEHSRLGREVEAGGMRYGAAALPADEEIVGFYEEAVERLARLGLCRYEISNFARPGFESAHNLKYWRREAYRGFGADAHSFDGATRWSNVRTAAEYVERLRARQSPVDQVERLDRRQSIEERFFLGLRQASGIEPDAEGWGLFAEPIRRLSGDGLLAREGARLRLTERGILLSNEVFQEFIGHA